MIRILFVVATVILLGLATYVQLDHNSYSGHSNAQLDILEAELRRVAAERALTEEELASFETLNTERKRRLLLPWLFAGAVLTACGAAFSPPASRRHERGPSVTGPSVRPDSRPDARTNDRAPAQASAQSSEEDREVTKV